MFIIRGHGFPESARMVEERRTVCRTRAAGHGGPMLDLRVLFMINTDRIIVHE
jgi:hypothetical protein